jgi:hypothetical protein
METATPLSDLHQDCLNKLNHALDLVLKTAEIASAENNHKMVIQAAREITRIATLITKMTDPGTKSRPNHSSGSGERPSRAPAALKNKTIGPRALDFILPDLDTFFPPREVANLDGVSQDLFKNISKNYQELQAIGAEMAASLDEPDKGNGNQS